MKTRDLIDMLIRADPTGDQHCTVNGIDISFAEVIPGYYDGPYEKIIRDERGYAVGGIISRQGIELRIHTREIEDAIFDEESCVGGYFPVCVQDCDGSRLPEDSYHWERIHEARKQARKYVEEEQQKDEK